MPNLRQHLDLDTYVQLLAQLEDLSIHYVLAAFQQLGWRFIPAQRFSSMLLGQQVGIAKPYQRLLERLLSMLAEVHLLRRHDDEWEVVQVPELTDLQLRSEALLVQYPFASAELTLLGRCARGLASVLRGTRDPLQLLFPNGDVTTATQLYQDSVGARWINTLIHKVITQACERLPKNRPVRILEIGAGTGGTTAHLLPHLPAGQTEYVFTDISPLFTFKAQARFRAYPFVKYQTLDIEKSPEIQGVKLAYYDIVIAANVVHATSHLAQTVQHLEQLLAPCGLFVLLEGTTPQRWLELIFGLTEGWWKFADNELRPTSPLLTTDQWQSLLERHGFRDVIAIPPADFVMPQQTVLVAEKIYRIPLSAAQQQLWVLSKMAEEGVLAYTIHTALALNGPLQVASLQQAVQQLTDRHEALRTCINEPEAGGHFQQILPTVKAELILLDFTSDPEAKLTEWFKMINLLPFDLTCAPLCRFHLVKLAEERFIFTIAIHHILADGWSISVILQELSICYSAICQQKTDPLPSTLQLSDYLHWQTQYSHTAEMAKHEAYWLQQLSGTLPILELPTDYPRPPVKTYHGGRQSRRLPADLNKAIKLLSKQQRCTPFMTLLAIYTVFLHRLTRQEDLIVGIATAGRSLPGGEHIVGYCTHLLAIRSQLADNCPFVEHLATTKKTLLNAYQHQDYPFARLINQLPVRNDASHAPLISTVFNLDHPVAVPPFFELTGNLLSQPIDFVPFDLSFSLIEVENELLLDCDYNTDLFAAETINRWLGHFHKLLASVIANPQQTVFTLPLLSALECQQILVDWNKTSVAYPERDLCLHHLCEQQAARTPEAIAVTFDGHSLTYRELNQRANQLAHYLQESGVKPETVVGICLERSLEMVIGLLGTLKAGGAYLPLEPSYPQDRLTFVLTDAQVPILLTQNQWRAQLPATKAQILCLDTEWGIVTQESSENPHSEVTPENLAYVIYTSGSTGKPKGVMNTHRGIVNRLLWVQNTYPLDASDSVLQKTPFSFDVSIWEFFWPLLTGARLVVAQPGGHQDSAYLAHLIATQKITLVHFVSPMLQIFLEEPGITNCHCLKRVICSGEALSWELQQRFFAQLATTTLHNLYGPTEAAVDVTFWDCQRDSPLRIVPIGWPIANMQTYILDRYLQPVPIGVPGELHLGGIGLARGYLNRPELTAEKFIYAQLDSENSETLRLYKTGDLARYLPDGAIEFLGRIDFQVKLRGFRIELGEIEAVLASHSAVAETIVLLRTGSLERKQLVAYVVLKSSISSEDGLIDDFRSELRKKLPEYMVPAVFVILEKLPLTANGKINRQALPAPARNNSAQDEVAPRTATERALVTIWTEVLGLKQIGIHDNFFEHGGNSLLAIQVISRLREIFAIEWPVRRLFEMPTIAELAIAIDAALAHSQDSPPQLPVIKALPRVARSLSTHV